MSISSSLHPAFAPQKLAVEHQTCLSQHRYSSWIRPKNLTALPAWIQQRRGQGGNHASEMCVEESGGMVKETLGHSAIMRAEYDSHPSLLSNQRVQAAGDQSGRVRKYFWIARETCHTKQQQQQQQQHHRGLVWRYPGAVIIEGDDIKSESSKQAVYYV
ncbi:hypothetical protein NQZ68_005933 [Dissostichus eleginoides]|nr:hypothetical protein NQZ68_005933 [Dissostichus eleginoides]